MSWVCGSTSEDLKGVDPEALLELAILFSEGKSLNRYSPYSGSNYPILIATSFGVEWY